MLIICYLTAAVLAVTMLTIALPSVTRRNMMHTSHARLHLCGMLCPSTYDDAECLNAAVEINMPEYNVATWKKYRSACCANGA